MATIYSQVEKNIRKTFFLMGAFFIVVIGIGWLFSQLLNNPLILYIAIFLAIFQNVFSYYYSDKLVLMITKARPLKKEENPHLYRILENLSITAGLPTPRLYIMEESQPNAFATGRDKDHAIVVVTRGLLEKLDKVELEGVLSHELAHIGNKDILYQTIIVILVGFVAILADFFLRLSFWGRYEQRRERNEGSLLAIFGIVAALLAPLVAQLIHLAISRKREFLADATGALITRYPEGLARALEKLAKDSTPMKITTNSTAHMFIVNPFKKRNILKGFSKLFYTHPPIEERIKALREMSV